ncbi:MAG: hypothetical protein WCP26_12285 [Actinomycetes bacterium]
MSDNLYAQLISLTAGTLLLTAALIVWRRSLRACVRLLAIQGIALAGLVAVLGWHERTIELVLVSLLVLGLKAVLLPLVLSRNVLNHDDDREVPRLNPTASLIFAALLTMLAYIVCRPWMGDTDDPTSRAVPIGIALVLIGFLLLITRRRAASQLIGFLVLDNGIATVAFLTATGVPFIVELGASLDVLLVVLILQVLTGRMQVKFGGTDLDDLTELKD